jgi:PAS domain S-box-containing protein
MIWIRSVMEGNEGRGEDEFRIIRRDGSIRYIHWQGIPLRDQGGRIVRLAGVAADVTEARLSELALRSSEELFRMAAEAAEQGVWNHDLDTGTIAWSARLWRIHGLPPGEGAPEKEARMALIHPEDRAEVLGLTGELLATGPNAVSRRSYRILRADGAVRTVERQAILLPGPDGQPARIVGVVHDVTEARDLAAQTMVADKLTTLGEMAGAIAHELAQPLQAVMATAATARMRLTQAADEATVERVTDRLAWIERQTARAGKTIQHLLAFSRGESSDGFSRLAEALEGAMELAGHGLRRERVEVSVLLPDDLPAVRGGQIAIEQVLVNLLNNARDAMAESETRRIRLEARLEGDLVRLDVTDTGSGVPEDKLERIFEPFYTTKPVGRGTGIGLSVARRMMQAMGGGIAVANTGSGARFTLTFRSALAVG